MIFRSSFLRDLQKIKGQRLRERIAQVIESVEQASNIQDIADLKKLSGFNEFYRIRVGDYRLGIALADGSVCVTKVGGNFLTPSNCRCARS